MAEFLIRVHDKINADSPYLDVKCLKRGDVVAVVPDGWAWSRLEQTLPFWRIAKVPGMALDEAQAFLVTEPGDPIVNKMLQKRQFKIDVDNVSIPAQIQTWLADDTRAQPFITIAVTTTRNLKKLKPPMPDPNVIA